MRITFDKTGAVGFVADTLAHNLAPEAWNDGRNMRVIDGYIKKMDGDVGVLGEPLISPNWLLPVPTTVDYFWLYANQTAVGVVDSASGHTDITRLAGAYTGGLDINWNGGMLQGIPILNNGVDVPQMWSPATPATKLVALTNWPGTWLTRCLRPFRAYLFALDMLESGTRYPHLVRWSHPADPGAVPVTWDPTDTTKDAGFASLPDTGGFLMDAVPLRDACMIYKEDQLWAFNYVGGNKVFDPRRLSSESGALTRDCACQYYSGGLRHAVFGGDDLYIHDGNTLQSIADRKVRRWLFNQIDPTYYRRCFVVPNYSVREVWFCFPESGQTLASLALPWSWEDNTFGPPRELPVGGTRYAAAGLITQSPNQAWNADTGTWDLDTSTWDERLYGQAARKVMICKPGTAGSKFLLFADITNKFNGTNMTSYVQRTGLAFARTERDGTPIADSSVRKLFKELWPRIEATPGTQIDIYAGTHDSPTGAITWQGPFAFIVGTHEKVTPLISGRFLAVKFQTASDVDWKLHGYDIEIEPVGVYR